MMLISIMELITHIVKVQHFLLSFFLIKSFSHPRIWTLPYHFRLEKILKTFWCTENTLNASEIRSQCLSLVERMTYFLWVQIKSNTHKINRKFSWLQRYSILSPRDMGQSFINSGSVDLNQCHCQWSDDSGTFDSDSTDCSYRYGLIVRSTESGEK